MKETLAVKVHVHLFQCYIITVHRYNIHKQYSNHDKHTIVNVYDYIVIIPYSYYYTFLQVRPHNTVS